MSYSQKVPGKNVLLVFLVFAELLLHTLKFDKHYFGPVAFQTLLMAVHFTSQPSSPSPHTHEKEVSKTILSFLYELYGDIFYFVRKEDANRDLT